MSIVRSVEAFTRKYLIYTLGVPILIMVGLDYIVALSTFIKAGCLAWISIQGLGLMIGIWLGAMHYLQIDSPWLTLPKYHLAKFVPSIVWGKDLAVWALKEDTNGPDSMSGGSSTPPTRT